MPPTLPNPICHAVPTPRALWPRKLMVNHYITIGIAENVPIATRNSASYSRCLLWWVFKRTTTPAIAIHMDDKAKRKQWRLRSEIISRSMDNPKAAIVDGTAWSYVPIWLYPFVSIMVGAKYAKATKTHVSKFWCSKGLDDLHTVGGNNEGEVYDTTKVDFIVLENIEDVPNWYVETSCRIFLLC